MTLLDSFLFMKVIASIVTYNSDIHRLKLNIEAILSQVNEIIIIDNGSSNVDDIQKYISKYESITIIKNCTNKGIATALNQAAEYAVRKGYEWIITLDQDSVAPENLVSTYSKFTYCNDIGIVCCKIVDRNFGELKEQKLKTKGYEEVPMCITSASMMNLNAWKQVGGFDEKMFIDSVDFDICLSMREYGLKIIRTYDAALLHEVGHSEIRKLFGKEYQIYHHSPLRYYYMVRNGIYLGKKHNFTIRAIYRAFRLFFLVILFEDDKFHKAKMMSLGFYHAIIHRYGKL